MRSGLEKLSRFGRTVMVVAMSSAAMGTFATSAGAEEVDWEKQPYLVKDGKIDYGTYNGFRRYHSACHVCHGPDALGSTYAPALKESLETMSYDDFLDTVVNGRTVTNAGNQQSVMPAFAESSEVMEYIDHIYAYLKARADGVVGRGRPKRLKPDEDPVFQEWKANK